MQLNTILKEFNTSIEELTTSQNGIIPLSREIIALSQEALWKMNNILTKNGFNSLKSEINYFKNIKPVIVSTLIYRKEVIEFESFFPKVCAIKQEKYFNRHFKKLQNFFNSHMDFGQYLEMNCTHLDQYYFTRNSDEKFIENGSIISLQNPKLCSSRGTLSAQFKAYVKLVIYIKKKKRLPTESQVEKIESVKWTGNKVDLIELIYAVHCSGSLRKGTGIKEIARVCEKLFEVDLGNYYRKFIELRNRKLVERTRYIDRLKSSLIQRMNEADD